MNPRTALAFGLSVPLAVVLVPGPFKLMVGLLWGGAVAACLGVSWLLRDLPAQLSIDDDYDGVAFPKGRS